MVEALAAQHGSFVQSAVMKLPKLDPPTKPNNLDASLQVIWGSNDVIDDWDETTVTGNTSRWNAGASQWQVGPSQIVASFTSLKNDPVGTVYSISNDDLIDMVSSDTNGFATMMLISTSHVSGTTSGGWVSKWINPPTLEVSIVPEPTSLAILSVAACLAFKNRRRFARQRMAGAKRSMSQSQ